MYKEKTDMTNQEMFTALMERIDSMDSGLNSRMDRLDDRIDRLDDRIDRLDDRMDRLDDRMDCLETRMDRLDDRMDCLETRMDHLDGRMDCLEARMEKMESDIEMEFKAVRIEMDRVYKVLKKDNFILNDKVDRLMIITDVDGYEKMKIQVEVLTQGYQKLSERIG